ncbi:nitroreductase family protein [Pseudomonas aeruginosa]|uniref:Nitroreductase family protein n=1 Tax=Salinicola corii TaxID=2606937 RepID=A0A640W9X7_9GAMM|nr:nitroreductase family protein [Salinicola corii]KAA0015242.1 nitroreductase family protein [Salinicola corii]
MIIDTFAKRRSQYALGRQHAYGQAQIEQIVRDAVRQAPSPFNCQSARVVVLFAGEHERLWAIVKSALAAIVDRESVQLSFDKIDTSFAAGIGTVLFFEDKTVIQSMQRQWPQYAENFPTWSEQSSGMAQFAVWTALAEADLGASLQHYNPLIDEAVRAQWALPHSWSLRAQMPFGSNQGPLPEKAFMKDTERFRSFG